MKSLALALVALIFLSISCSRENQTEEIKVETNSADRTMKKTIHRINEVACVVLTGDNEVECLAKKMKSGIESKDAIMDKANEVKNKLDEDKY